VPRRFSNRARPVAQIRAERNDDVTADRQLLTRDR